jgi:hypothetical protein
LIKTKSKKPPNNQTKARNKETKKQKMAFNFGAFTPVELRGFGGSEGFGDAFVERPRITREMLSTFYRKHCPSQLGSQVDTILEWFENNPHKDLNEELRKVYGEGPLDCAHGGEAAPAIHRSAVIHRRQPAFHSGVAAPKAVSDPSALGAASASVADEEDRQLKQAMALSQQEVLKLSQRVEHEPPASWDTVGVNLGQYGFVAHDVGGEGDCQFRVLADHLFGDAERHYEVRQQVVHELTTHPERYRSFVTDDIPYEWYTVLMADRGYWGDAVTIRAAANAYGVSVNVVSTSRSLMTTPPECITSRPDIWMAFLPELHYRAVRPLG